MRPFRVCSHIATMINHSAAAGLLSFVLAVIAGPTPPQTVEQVCATTEGRLQDARVRVAWTVLPTSNDEIQISYCILRGEKDAKLDFERDAEIVYFALASEERNAPRRTYVFTIKTSEGRTIEQGPATLQPVARQPQSCRVEVCQFFTNPGERVIEVTVVTSNTVRAKR
jgi:hypothetical protein